MADDPTNVTVGRDQIYEEEPDEEPPAESDVIPEDRPRTHDYRVYPERRRFDKDGWRTIEQEELKQLGEITKATLRQHPHRHTSPLDCVQLMWNDSIMQHIVNYVKRHAPSTKLAREITIDDLWLWFGTRLDMDLHSELRLFRAYLQSDHVNKKHMERLKFEMYNPRITCDIKKILKLLHKNIDDTFTFGSQCTIDELILTCGIDSALLVKIDGKPHPLGFLIWLCAQRLDDQAIVKRAFIRMENRKHTVHEVVAKLLAKQTHEKTHVTGDSWFNTKRVREYLNKKKFMYTMNTKGNTLPHVWKTLMHHIGVVESQFAHHLEKDIVVQATKGSVRLQLMSTLYTYAPNDNNTEYSPWATYNRTSRWVDNINQLFYNWPYHHRNTSEKICLLLGLWRIAVINGHSIYNNLNQIKGIDTFNNFLRSLADEILEKYKS